MKRQICLGAVALATLCATALPISEEEAARAAASFVTTDAIGSMVLGGRSVAKTTKRGDLWIASLSPSGHIILSASDLAKPIVGFSENDFREPSPDSPAFALLESASAAVRRLEADASAVRNVDWDALLAPPRRTLLGADAIEPSKDSITIEPFVTSIFAQDQPFNDFAPVFCASTNSTYEYQYQQRGRCPSGCVATATAAMLRHFRWPARIDRTAYYDKTIWGNDNFLNTNGYRQSFPIRFDGHTPIDWDSIADEYTNQYSVTVTNYYGTYYNWNTHTEYDLRGVVAESNRFPIARLNLWIDTIAQMDFGPYSSSANYDPVARSLSEWYTEGGWIYDSFEEHAPHFLSNGIPLQVSFARYENGDRYGHQLLMDGWAQNGSKKYAHFRFGWDGLNDGFYDIGDGITGDNYAIEQIYVGHFPRAKPQLDPLPSVCPNDVTIAWHFPDCFTNNLSGFTVSAQKMGTNPSDFTDDFSQSTGASSSGAFFIATDSERGLDGPLLMATSEGTAYYSFPSTFVLTSASVLTFNLRSRLALGNDFEVQASFDNGDWETIMTPALSVGSTDSGWGMVRLYLGNHGGQTCKLRLYKYLTGGNYYPNQNCILIDNIRLADILAPETTTTQSVGSDVRTATFSDLDAGSTYAFSVTPILSGALADAEPSDSITVTIEGSQQSPKQGTETYTSTNLNFPANNAGGLWTYNGTLSNSTEIKDIWGWSIYASILGKLTTNSKLTFNWKANNYYGDNSFDVYSVNFFASDGNSYLLKEFTNTTERTTYKQETINLGPYANLSGIIVISYSHNGSNYTNGNYTGNISSMKITGVLSPTTPSVSWQTKNYTALGMPRILSVEPAAEGFYMGCGVIAAEAATATTGGTTSGTATSGTAATTTFTVKCTEKVTSLRASPSHLELVRDEDIQITPDTTEAGKFTVAITPSGVNPLNYRSRMILTLAATDENGTTAYKDLSLRFDEVAEAIPGSGDGGDQAGEVVVVKIPGDESGASVSIPVTWFTEKGLDDATTGTTQPGELDFAAIAGYDSDGDGISNWQEYICGTNPTNREEKIECVLTFDDNGNPVATAKNVNNVAGAYEAVIKGTDDISDATSWVNVTPGTPSSKHFYKVVIEAK